MLRCQKGRKSYSETEIRFRSNTFLGVSPFRVVHMKNDFRGLFMTEGDITYVPHQNWRSDTLSNWYIGDFIFLKSTKILWKKFEYPLFDPGARLFVSRRTTLHSRRDVRLFHPSKIGYTLGIKNKICGNINCPC